MLPRHSNRPRRLSPRRRRSIRLRCRRRNTRRRRIRNRRRSRKSGWRRHTRNRVIVVIGEVCLVLRELLSILLEPWPVSLFLD